MFGYSSVIPFLLSALACTASLVLAGCDNGNPKAEPKPEDIVTETIRPTVETQLGVAWEVKRNLDLGKLKWGNVDVNKSVPPQYVVTGPRVIVEKLKRLASGEWLFVILQPKTEAARNAVKLQIHKFTASGLEHGGLDGENDVRELVPNVSWIVVGRRELIEGLQKVANPE